MTGTAVGSTVGSIVPGIGTAVGATLGSLYDMGAGLFGSKPDPNSKYNSTYNQTLIANLNNRQPEISQDKFRFSGYLWDKYCPNNQYSHEFPKAMERYINGDMSDYNAYKEIRALGGSRDTNWIPPLHSSGNTGISGGSGISFAGMGSNDMIMFAGIAIALYMIFKS